MKKTRIVSIILTFAMLLSFGAFNAFSDGEADYEQVIYANGGPDFYTGTCPGYVEGSTTFSTQVSPLWNGVSAVVGQEDRTYGVVNGYGKEDGDEIYRYTKLEWYGDFQLICFGHGLLTEKRDQVGEFSYRLGAEQAIKLGTNRMDNEAVSQLVIPRTDNLWHRLTWAYNSELAETSVWVDGKYLGKMTGKSAGLWVLTTAWLCEGEFIELDDVKVWTLKPEASAIVSGEGDSVVYESYNRIVSEKLCNIEFAPLEGEDFIASSTEGSITVENAPTCADVIYEAENNEGVTGAVIYNSDFTEILGDVDNPGGGTLVVEKTAASGSKAYGYYKILDGSLYFEYQKAIVADGESSYMGNSAGYSDGAANWASARTPEEAGAQVVTLDKTNGYGKKAGEKVYRFTSESTPGSWYHFLCFGNGIPGNSGDMVGEFSYRLGSGQGVWLIANRSYNGATGDNKIITLPYKDDLWHTLSFAYNSVTHDTTFYVDGEFYASLNFPTAGLWVVSSSGITAGKFIEFDDLKVYHLTTATSGVTHVGDNGTVYDSYDYIVNEKLDNSGKYEISTSDTVISADAIKVEVAIGTTVEALVADVKSDSSVSYAAVINAETGSEAEASELAAEKTLAVSKVNKNGSEIVSYYSIIDAASGFEYEREIYSDGENFWLGNAPGYSEGAATWASTSYPYNSAASDAVSATVPGFGKQAGDKIFRYSGTGIAGSWYQFICFGNGVPGASGDMVGELNYRMGDGHDIWITGNRSYNGEQCSAIVTLPYKDNLWHHLTFAYNSVTHETTFWNDGEYMNKLTFPSAGLWIVSSAKVSDGKTVDMDELKGWSLNIASSGKTHIDENGATVYDSYNYIVNDKLDNNAKAELSAGEIILSVEDNTIGILEGSTCIDVIAEVEESDESLSAVVIDSMTGFECKESEAAEGKLLAVSKSDKNGVDVITYFNIVKEERFKLRPLVYADGSNYYMGDSAGYVEGAQNWASAGNPFNCGASVEIGGDVNGYGKKDGDKIIRFTKEGIPAAWYQFLCFGNGVPGNSGDFVGELEYRLGSGQDVWITGNRSYNGELCSAIVTLPYVDKNWHTLTFAYNSVTHETTFWNDGEYLNKLTFPTAGLWLVSGNGIYDGMSIDFDNLKMWMLTEETSGMTYEADGKTVYESYDYIVSEKLKLKPQLNASEEGKWYIHKNEIITKKNTTAADLSALASDVTVIGADGKAVTGDSILASGMSAVVTEDGVIRTYTISVYNEGKGILYSDLTASGDGYKVIVYNPGSESINVNGYIKNTSDGSVKTSKVTVDAGGVRAVETGSISADNLILYLWNDSLAPLCKPLSI